MVLFKKSLEVVMVNPKGADGGMFSKNNKKIKFFFLKKCGLKTNSKYCVVFST